MTDQKHRVLVIDDDTHVRESLSRLLRHHGFDTSTSSSAGRSLEKLRNGEELDCIIVDLLMPGINGKEFVETLEREKLFPLERVIIMTAVQSADNATAYMQYGCCAYCGKPWDNATVLEQVKRACGISETGEGLKALV